MILAPLLPEFTLITGAIVLMMVAAFVPRAGRITSGGAVALLVAATVMLIGPARAAGPMFGGLIQADAFGAFGKLLIFLGAAVAIVGAHGWFAEMAGGDGHSEHGAEYPVLILFSAVGMAVMVSASSLITLYVGLELQSLAAYVLASYRRGDARSAEAGLKYFVLGSLASGILLYGISLLYGFTGSTEFGAISAAFLREGPHSLGLLFGLVFLLAGLAFKISAVPFHMWTPDVYEGAPTPVTAFFASAPKVAAVLLATRVCFGALGPAIEAWRQIVTVVALGSILLGAVAAYGQTNIKRLLAYSSINNVGFALIGIAAGGRSGAAAVLSYMAVYIVMTLGAFLCVLRLREENGEPVENMAALSGLSQSHPTMAAALASFMLSLAGLPPFFGFWPKLRVFTAAVDSGLITLAVIGILGTVVGAYYYLKIVKIMYFDAPVATLGRVKAPLEGALIAAAALFVSPLGYGLMGGDRTDGDDRREQPVLSRIRVVERAGSTNAVLLGDADANEGDWLVALVQDAGRGRQGRAWDSPPGNFAGSTLVHIRPGDPPPQTLSLACGLALIEAVGVVVPDAPLLLKWPNDLLLDGAKLAGILLERSGDRIVAGFGVNLAAAPAIPGRATAALKPLAEITPQAFAPLLAASVARMLHLWRGSDPAAFARAWLARAHPVGSGISVHDTAGVRLSGQFDGLEADGALRLRIAGGAVEVIRTGDVSL